MKKNKCDLKRLLHGVLKFWNTKNRMVFAYDLDITQEMWRQAGVRNRTMHCIGVTYSHIDGMVTRKHPTTHLFPVDTIKCDTNQALLDMKLWDSDYIYCTQDVKCFGIIKHPGLEY